MLRVGELAVEEYRSFCGDMNCGGIEDADVPRGGVPGVAVVGRDQLCCEPVLPQLPLVIRQ